MARLVCLLCIALSGYVHADERIAQLAGKQAVVRLYDGAGRLLYDYSTLSRFIPASTIKLVTALLVLDKAGEGYRFRTPLYMDDDGNILIHGQGDPFFVSEEISAMTEQLLHAGIKTVNSIVLDDSSMQWFIAPGQGNSANPYDAGHGALVVNFNSVYVEKGVDGSIASSESQTPLTETAVLLASHLPVGRQRINVGTDRTASLRYAHQLVYALFSAGGITVSQNTFTVGVLSGRWQRVLTYTSSLTLAQLVRAMMTYSNNVIANMTAVALINQKGEQRTLSQALLKSREALKKRYSLTAENIYLDEFSGISRKNSMTVSAMESLLLQFKRYAYLLDTRDGALVKSGTLNGIYNYVGYFQDTNELLPFMIITYSQQNNRDRLLKLLQQKALTRTRE